MLISDPLQGCKGETGRRNLVGVDALAEAVQDVLDGNMTGTVLNDDVGQATAAAEATKLYVEGSKVEQYYWVDYVKVTKDNASEYAK